MLNCVKFWVLLLIVVVGSLVLLPKAMAASLSPSSVPFPQAQDNHTLEIKSKTHSLQLTMAAIESLPHYELTTAAPWGMEGIFSGVLLKDLLKLSKLDHAEKIFVKAMDDYKITLIPALENGFDEILFVTRFNGHPMSLKEKGPFRLIWAQDADTATAGTSSTVKWIWSIAEIREAR